MAIPVSPDDVELLKKVAITAMTGKGAEASKEKLADMCVKAVKAVVETEDGKDKFDIDNIKIEKKVGGSIDSSELVEGMIIDKERVSTGMPKSVDKANIALINGAIELKDTEVDAEISITSPDQLQAFLSQEEQMIKGMVDKIKSKGATVVFCQKGIDDLAQHYLAKAGILAARRVKKSDMEKLARATNAKIASAWTNWKKATSVMLALLKSGKLAATI